LCSFKDLKAVFWR